MTDSLIVALELDKSFVPPYPDRPQERPSVREALRRAQTNILSIFHDRDFLTRQIKGRLLTRQVFICNNPDGVRETLSEQSETFAPKAEQQKRALGPILGDATLLADGREWQTRRAAIEPLLGAASMTTLERVTRDSVVGLCARWHRKGRDAALDILEEMNALSAEILARRMFGATVGAAHAQSLGAAVSDYLGRVDPIDAASLLGAPGWLPRRQGAALRAGAEAVERAFEAAIAEADAAQEAGEATLLAALRDRFPGAPKAVREELIGLFVAGHETLSMTLSWALYLVSQSERVRGKMVAEFERVLSGRLPRFEDLESLTYTRAVIEETLRLYPPLPLLARSAAAAGTVNRLASKKGDLLIVAPWLVHRNRTVWSLPDHFVPERFDAANNPLRDEYSFIAFSAGPRACPAREGALAQATFVLATLFQAFDVSLETGHEVTAEGRPMLRPGRTLPMRVRWRASVGLAGR